MVVVCSKVRPRDRHQLGNGRARPRDRGEGERQLRAVGLMCRRDSGDVLWALVIGTPAIRKLDGKVRVPPVDGQQPAVIAGVVAGALLIGRIEDVAYSGLLGPLDLTCVSVLQLRRCQQIIDAWRVRSTEPD